MHDSQDDTESSQNQDDGGFTEQQQPLREVLDLH